MAKISEYSDAGTLDGTELVPVDDSGTTKHTTSAAIAGLSSAAIATVASNLAAHATDGTSVHGIADTSKLVSTPDGSAPHVVICTQAAYDALGPGRPATTVYDIVG